MLVSVLALVLVLVWAQVRVPVSALVLVWAPAQVQVLVSALVLAVRMLRAT